MYAEFQSLIENYIWESRKTSSGQAILTARRVIEIKKDRWGSILKFEAQ